MLNYIFGTYTEEPGQVPSQYASSTGSEDSQSSWLITVFLLYGLQFVAS